MNQKIGITERGDPSIDLAWTKWVEEGHPAILITKNPALLLDHLKRFESPNVIVHTTITGYGGSILEPNVPFIKDSLGGYKDLILHLSAERVVLRIDPIIPLEEELTLSFLVLEIVKEIYSEIPTRVRISFIDQYPHVKRRLEAAGIKLPWDTLHAPLKLRQRVWETMNRPEVCGEPGFECTGCVSKEDCRILGVTESKRRAGQRVACACLGNKIELLSNKKQCQHRCAYCYWVDD